MKIVFSRKGFDKDSGGIPSLIFPHGGLCSLPIPATRWINPSRQGRVYEQRFRDLSYEGENLGEIVEKLTLDRRTKKPRIRASDFCHLDPDLIKEDLPRKRGWLPMFGPAPGAATHLFEHGVREGDLFLFFGWFDRLRKEAGRLKFGAREQDAHVIFGWLQVGEIWCMFGHKDLLPRWARNFSHVGNDWQDFYNVRRPIDTVFVAKRHLQLDLPGIRRRLPGGGAFKTFHMDLCLTEPNESRSVWRLPGWMYPSSGFKPLSHHGDRSRWEKRGRLTRLHAVGRGQEFVLDLDCEGCSGKYPREEAYKWLAKVFGHA